ncbi:protein kinase family protein [Mycobacterium sp. ITM-2016-00318]|uniref:protein kinase family protein n=1 Tax=Mycobacterium sp. ITM-2016-00318 TaxID=2099693 RepID=UPI00287FCD36|nr:protein kinase family protein [Mycobacterium sp. ITM-2016-00318]WNG94490.1 protein kinase family protein [Mycobacterium sp. ITM-2016-00318]
MTDRESDENTAPLPVAVKSRGDTDAPTSLVPGAVIAGRYRLMAIVGAEDHVEFWQGTDTVTGSLVALSLVDVAGELPVERVNEILSRTSRLRGFDVRGVARILDVIQTGDLGVVVADWIPGGTLREVADTSPSPTAAAAALESLIVAAELARDAGVSLNISHPSRIRISTDGHAVLAYAATMPETTPQDDLRGIGGILYALLIGRWPPQEAMPSGWPPVDLEDAGWPKEPAAIDPSIPFLISIAAVGLLRHESGVGSASELLSLLRHGRPAVTPARPQDNSRLRIMPVLAPPPPGAYATFRNVDTAAQVMQARRQMMKTILVASAAIFFVAVMSLGSTLNRVLGDSDDVAALDADRLGLSPSSSAAAAPPSSPDSVGQTAAEASIVPVKAVVFSPGGSADNPQDVGKSIDGDPATAWSTDRYYDADPFPKFKQGLGLLLELPQPTVLSSLTIDLRSTGTFAEIRSAADENPKTLADTTELSPRTLLQPGPNRIELSTQTPVSTVLVWISTLGATDGNNRTEISEITLSTTARA